MVNKARAKKKIRTLQNQQSTSYCTARLLRTSEVKRVAATSRPVAVARYPADVQVDLLSPADWRTLRSMRIKALRDAPDAFLTTLADVKKWRTADWVAGIESSTWTVARAGREVVGIACLMADLK
jgi:hypothetical protein